MNTFDLIINLVVKNQDAIKSIGRDLKVLESLQGLSRIIVPEISIPEPTIANAIKFGKQINDVAPLAIQISELLGPVLIDGLLDATNALSRMAAIADGIGPVSIDATFDPSNSVEKSFARSTQAAKGLSLEVGEKLANSARDSADSIDDVADSLSRVKESGPISRPSVSFPQISLSPKTLDDTIALFDVIKATYSITTQLAQAFDRVGGSRSGQINAIAQALTGVSKLVSDIYGISIGFNDKEIKAIATSIVGLAQPLKDVGKAAINFKDSISMAGFDPSKWMASYEGAAKDLGAVLGGVGKVALQLKKNLTNADGDASSLLKLIDLNDLKSGLSGASQKAIEFKKNFDLNDLPKTILATAKAADEAARSIQAISNVKNPFADQDNSTPFEKLKTTIAQVAEKYKELQGVKLPPLNPKDAIELAQALGTTSDKAKQLQQDLNLQPKAIITALNELNRFASVNLPLREQFKILNAEMGITKQQFSKLKEIQSGGGEKAPGKLPQQLEPIASEVIDFGLVKVNGDARILIQTLRAVSEKLQEIKSGVNFKPLPTNEAVAFAQALGLTATQARSLQKDLNLPTGTITSALSSIRQFESVKLPLKEQFQSLNQELGITKQQFDQIKKIKDIAPEDKTGLGLAKTFEGVSKVAFGYNQITTAVGSMVSRVNPAYAAMIGANEQLQQQLLKSAATITATSAVSSADGTKLGNLESIKALQPKLKATLREVEIATQSLVGVTSQQTSEVFNVILTNTGYLNGQLKSATDQAQKFKDPLDAAAKLAPGMVATLGTLGLPLSQASDEIGNLLKGEIDNTAQVAKSLGITKQMVEAWKSQGTLVDQLTKRFDPFLKANAEASRSVGGITSNIQDMFEIMNREAGKPVTNLYIDALDGVYKYLQKVMPGVQAVFTSIVEQQVTTIQAIAGSMKPLFDGIMVAVTALAPTIEPAIRSSLGLIAALFKTLEPVFSAIGQVVGVVGKALAAMIPFIIQANAIFGVLASTTFNIGIALNLLNLPMQILVAAITAVAGAIEKIAKDPLGGILIQAIGLTVVLAPLVNTMLSLSATVAALGGFFAWLPGAIAGFQTLLIVASSFLPFGGAISAALASATLAVNRFFAAVLAGARPPVLINFLRGAIVQLGLMAKTMLAQAIPATIALAKELGTFAVQIIPRVIAGFAAMQTGGITAGFAALSAGLPILSGGFAGLAAATNLAAAAATNLLLAYGPLLVVVAAVGVTLLAKSAKDLADVNQELEDVSKTNNAISDATLKTTEKLKKLQDAQSKGGLSAAQKTELKDALFAGKQQIALIDDQIAKNKELREDSQKRGANEEQLSTFDRLIKDKEREKETLSKLANEIKIASQPLAELGTTSEQMAQKVRSATRLIEAGVGDPTKYAAAAKELTGLLQKQVELGQITADEAAKQLAILKNNTKLDYESQLAAKEAIVKIYSDRFAKIDELQSSGQLSNAAAEQELEAVRTNSELQLKVRVDAGKKLNALRKETSDAEIAEIGAQTAEIAAKKALGTIGEAEAAKQTSATKLAESKVRIEQQQAEAANELNPEARRKLEAEIRKSQAEITKIEAEERDRRNAERLKDFDEQGKILQAGLDKGRVTEEEFNAKKKGLDEGRSTEELKQLNEKFAKLNKTDKEGREAIQSQIAEAESKQESNKKAANERELATLQQSLDKTADAVRDAETNKKLEVEKAIADGVKTRADGEAEIAKVVIEGAEKTIEAERSKLEKLKSFPPFLNPKENEALQNQIRDQENKTSELQLGLIKKRIDAERSALEERKKLIDEEYNRKNQTSKNADLDSQLELEKAVLGGSITRAEADNKIAQSAKARIDSEFAAEKDKYDKLNNLKPLTNPEEERRRQDSLRQAEEKLKQAELAGVKKAQEVKRSNEEVEKNIARDRAAESEKDQKNAAEFAKATLDEIVAANYAADSAIQTSKRVRLEDSKKTEFEALKQDGFDTEKIAREAAKRELAIEQESLEKSYQLKLAQSQQLKQLLADREISGEAAMEADRKLQQELGELNLKRIDLEKKALAELRAEKVRLIELDSLNTIKPLQARVDLLTQQKGLIEQQNNLLNAQQRLEGASFNLAKQRLGFAIEDAKASGDEGKAKQLEVQAAQENLAFTQQGNVAKLEAVQLAQEQKAIEMAMAVLTAQIASIQAKANLEKAIIEGKSAKEIDALTREVGLKTTIENLTNRSAENQKTISGKEVAAARLEAQASGEAAERQYAKATGSAAPVVSGGYIPGAAAAPFVARTPIVEPQKPIEPKPVPKPSAPTGTTTRILGYFGGDGGNLSRSEEIVNSQGVVVGRQSVPLKVKELSFDRKGNPIDDSGKRIKPEDLELNPKKPIAEAAGKPAPIGPKTGKPSGKPGEDAKPTADLTKPIADVATGSESLGKSLNRAVSAIDQFSDKLAGKAPTPTAKAIPARFAGGPIGAGEPFTGAELGPELARHADGSYQMLLMPGIYSLDRSAQIIPAHETQQILQSSSMMSTTNTTTIAVTDNSDLLHELRQLRSIVASRHPMVSNNITFDRPSSDGTDRAFAEFSRMLVRAI